MGVSRFDSTVGGLGGCPFAGQKGAAGQHLHGGARAALRGDGHSHRHRSRQADRGRAAWPEEIVGHQLPSELIHAGSLDAFRRKAA
jgi:hydroxymethylglutaryl-CoA lyase